MVLRESSHNTIDSNPPICSSWKGDEASHPDAVLRIFLQSLNEEDLWITARTALEVLTLSCEHLARSKCSSCLCMWVCLEGVFYADSKGRGMGFLSKHCTTLTSQNTASKNSWENLVCVSSQFGFEANLVQDSKIKNNASKPPNVIF